MTPQNFDEIQVFNSVAERTGNRVARTTLRGGQSRCNSLAQLGTQWRRLGDGYYYLASTVWPAEVTELDLHKAWQPLA